MFSYLLYRGLRDIWSIFNTAGAISPAEILQRLEEANTEAVKVWSDEDRPFVTRLETCKTIIDPVANLILPSTSVTFNPIPEKVAGGLDTIFAKHYNPGNYLLIGRTEHEAQEAQRRYAQEVAILLGLEYKPYETRALFYLGRVYGCTSIPLLSLGSVLAMWDLCRSPFYRRQLSLVSIVSLCIIHSIDARFSCTSGSSRSQSLWGHEVSVVTMSRPSTDSLGR